MDFFTNPLLNGRPWLNTAFINSAGIQFADGTQAAPSISFFNDTTLGFYLRGAGQLGVAAGGNSVTFWTSTGQTWPTAVGSFTFNGIGIVATEALNLSNGNNAAAGAQQGAPFLRFGGFGWGTTAGTSQAVDWRLRSLPIQSTVPGAQLLFEFSVNGGAYATFVSIDSSPNGNITLTPTGTGQVRFTSGLIGTPSIGFTASPTEGFFLVGGSRVGLISAGTVVAFAVNAATSGLAVSNSLHFTAVTDGSSTDTRLARLGVGQLGLNRDAIAVTSGDGFVLYNGTAATAGVPVQMSPRFRLLGAAWNSVALASEADSFFLETLPATVAGTTTQTLRFGSMINAGAATYPMTLTSGGIPTFTGLAGVGNRAVIADANGVLSAP